MFISIFSDELALDVTEALPIIRSWGLTHVDFRSRVFGKEIHALSAEELVKLKALCADNGLQVACLQSSLAKVHLPDAERCRAEEQKLEGLIRAADALDCRLIRTFHYWQPKEPEMQGALAVRPDELAKVLDLFAPLAARAKAAGLRLAFENCGVTPAEVLSLVEALGVKEWGVAWDVANGWDCGERLADEAAFVRLMAERSIGMHVKARRAIPGLNPLSDIRYEPILSLCQSVGFTGPVSIETHNPDKTVSNQEMSRRLVNVVKAAWPSAAPGTQAYSSAPKAVVSRPWESDPVRFVVVGLGMGHNRSRTVVETPGTRLVGVCDVVEERAKRSAEAFGVPYSLDVQEWLDNDQVEVVYVLTETGRHAEIAIRALEAGKHVISTKPMEASLAACDGMIRAAEANGRLLAVDFGRRFGSSLLALKESVAVGDLGRPLGATFNLKIQRTMEYFRSNGGWRGTRRWDGGGVLSNQAIHHIDEIVFVLGVPARVRCDIWTQDHDIEAEDLGSAVWQYANGMIVTFTATTSFPHSTWYSHLELHGTAGAYYEVGGGPFAKPETKWFVDGKWSGTAPRAGQGEWLNTADNVAAALRQGAPLVCDGREGRRTQSVLDAMYRSAYAADGGWVDVAADLP